MCTGEENFINKVFLGDVLETLSRIPDGFVDLVITSPPYNKKGVGGWLVRSVEYDVHSDSMPEEEYQDWQVRVLDELYRVVKDGGHLFYNHKVRYERGELLHPLSWISRSRWKVHQEIVWDRGIAGNIRGWRFWQVDERIYWLTKGRPKELPPEHAKLTSIWRIRPEPGHKVHPAVFPLALPARVILSVLQDRPGIVLDPFCGTGTTLVAARLLGKDYIGIDLSPLYVEYAKRRLENCEREREVLLLEQELHRIRTTYADRKAKGKVRRSARVPHP